MRRLDSDLRHKPLYAEYGFEPNARDAWKERKWEGERDKENRKRGNELPGEDYNSPSDLLLYLGTIWQT